MLHTQCSLCLLGLDIDTIFTKDRLTIEVCLVVKCVCVCVLAEERVTGVGEMGRDAQGLEDES